MGMKEVTEIRNGRQCMASLSIYRAGLAGSVFCGVADRNLILAKVF